MRCHRGVTSQLRLRPGFGPQLSILWLALAGLPWPGSSRRTEFTVSSGNSTATWRICARDTVWHHRRKTLMVHLLRARQKAYCVTPKIQNQKICLRKEPWRNPLPCLSVEALVRSGRCQTATLVIIRSGVVGSERRNLPHGSKHVRLYLACQAVKNMFTSGGRSYSVPSSLSREEIYLACTFLYARTCIKEHGSSWSGVVVLCGLLFWLTDWLNERVDQRYAEEGLLIACVLIFSQLRPTNCLRTVLLLLRGLILWQAISAQWQRFAWAAPATAMLSWETSSVHNNLCLQKWTYFLLLDKQGIVLRALIQEVSFYSRYFGMATCPVERKLWIQTCWTTRKKLTLCCIQPVQKSLVDINIWIQKRGRLDSPALVGWLV